MMLPRLYLAAGLTAAALIGVGAVYLQGRADGRRAAEHAQQERALNAANERARADGDAASGDALDRLREHWTR